MTEGQYQARRRNQKKEKNCGSPINRIDGMDQTIIASKNICAQRNGPKAVDLVKSTESGCPTGYKACSSQTTNWWDRVCIEDAKDIQTDCPILSVQFTPLSQVAGLGSSWKFQQFSTSYAVTYTKT